MVQPVHPRRSSSTTITCTAGTCASNHDDQRDDFNRYYHCSIAATSWYYYRCPEDQRWLRSTCCRMGQVRRARLGGFYMLCCRIQMHSSVRMV